MATGGFSIDCRTLRGPEGSFVSEMQAFCLPGTNSAHLIKSVVIDFIHLLTDLVVREHEHVT